MGLFFIGLGVLKLLITVFVVLLVVKLGLYAFSAFHERSERSAEGKAEQTLRRRFAEGEIEAADYRERLKVLREDY
jgi:uncharacterized membrane protein